MKQYASLRKKNSGSLASVILLLICVVLSAALLLDRLLTYSPAEDVQRIPLTRSNGLTHVTATIPDAAAPRTGGLMLTAPLMMATPGMDPIRRDDFGFRVKDDTTVWTGETAVEIFSIRYDNASGETTVRSRDGVKVLAPGTGSRYDFELQNTGRASLDYTMEMDAWFSDTQYPIPVVVSVCDGAGHYYLGSGDEAADVLRLSEVKTAGTLAAGYVQGYSLAWEWPFEQDDAYDTMLGNLAVDEDITLTIQIRTTATGNPDPDAPGGAAPDTGDTIAVGMYAVLMVASLGGMLLLLLRRKEEPNETP